MPLQPEQRPRAEVRVGTNYQGKKLGVGEIHCQALVAGGGANAEACIDNPWSEAKEQAIDELCGKIDELVERDIISSEEAEKWKKDVRNWKYSGGQGYCHEPYRLYANSLDSRETINEKLRQLEGQKCGKIRRINTLLEE